MAQPGGERSAAQAGTLHFAIYAFNRRGFIKRGPWPSRAWNYEPPAWAAWGSLIAAAILAVVFA